jgi:hypothetical protein
MRILAIFVLVAISAWAELLMPMVSIGGSSDGRFLVRGASILPEEIQLFTLSSDGKSYQLVTQFRSLGFFSRGVVSEDGSYVVAFESAASSEEGKAGNFVCVYSSKGERICKWRLEEIVSKEDRDLVSDTPEGPGWWDFEIGVGGKPEEVLLVGPVASFEVIERRFCYVMDMKTRFWRKLGDRVLPRRPNQSPEPTAMSVTPPAAQESRQP